jgi:hypothetical protein
MTLGSHERARESALHHVLRRRLSTMDPKTHTRYLEVECCRIVEFLRRLRDEYRRYFEGRNAKPVAEMYWVVVRFGVKDWAVVALREAALEYMRNSRIDMEAFQSVYGSPQSTIPLGRSREERSSIEQTINVLLDGDAFDQVLVGGPFGRDNQIRIGRASAGLFWGGKSLPERIKERQELWDKCCPWTEGLARLFDATQEELLFQFGELGDDGRRAEKSISRLTTFQRIAYMHMRFRSGTGKSKRNLGDDGWLTLLRALDEAQLRPSEELSGRPRDLLATAGKKGHAIDKWEPFYHSKTRVTLDDGKIYSIKREVMHAIHNACKSAEDQLKKVWSSES